MRPPATSGGRVDHGQPRRAPASGGTKTKRPKPRKPLRSSIKASRGPSSPPRQRAVAEPRAHATRRQHNDRAAATREQSLRSMDADYARAVRRRAETAGRKSSPGAAPSRGSGGIAVRAVAAGAGGAAAVAAVATKPAAAAARPMLRVVSGGLEKLPAATAAQPYLRGRLMILLAAALGAGLIYINVGKLEGSDAYSNYAQRSVELQRENTALRAQVSSLSSAERIQRYAKRFGMVAPLPEQFTYLRGKRGDALRGARGYTAPSHAGSSPTVAPQQASGSPATNQTPVGTTGTDTPSNSTNSAPTGGTQTSPGASAPAQAAPPAGTQGAAGTNTGAATVGGGQ